MSAKLGYHDDILHDQPGTFDILLLSRNLLVDVGAVASTHLYTVPTGKKCVVTAVYIHTATASFNQATDPIFNIGWDATASNVVNTATYTTPAATTTAIPLTVLAECAVGSAASILHFNVTTAATASTTCTVDVYGYLVAV